MRAAARAGAHDDVHSGEGAALGGDDTTLRRLAVIRQFAARVRPSLQFGSITQPLHHQIELSKHPTIREV